MKEIFGRWTVIEKPSQMRWLCQCVCGSIKWVNKGNLLRGKTKSCGCLERELASFRQTKDLTNLRFTKFVALRQTGRDLSGKLRWTCQCDCGVIKEVNGADLISGKIKSCGCLGKLLRSQRRLKDITGKKFGQLIVLRRISNIGEGKKIKWLCQCDCGTIKSISGSDLKYKGVVSCGCIKSVSELKIKNWLDVKHIQYIYQWSFNKSRFKYDFLIYPNILIEYQGEQHFKPIGVFGGENTFNKQKQRDLKKKKLAEKNNYDLHYISYKDDIIEKLQNIIPSINQRIIKYGPKATELS